MNHCSRDEHVFTTAASGELIIDGFGFRPSAGARACTYVLSHFHSDHYRGLDAGFPWGSSAKLFATEVTAALAVARLGLDPATIVGVPLDTPVRLLPDLVATFVTANHCPGSALLVLEYTPKGSAAPVLALHTGDFRYNHALHSTNAVLAAAVQGEAPSACCGSVLNPLRYPGAWVPPPRSRGLDAVYLDTTYAHPRHTLPPQEDSIAQGVALVGDLPRCASVPTQLEDTLVLVSAYVIGKERLVCGLAGAAAGSSASSSGTGQPPLQVYVSPSKLALLRCAGLPPSALACFTCDRGSASIHVVGMGLCGKTWPYFQPDYGAVTRYANAVNVLVAGSGRGGGGAGSSSSGGGGGAGGDEDDDEEAAFLAAAAAADEGAAEGVSSNGSAATAPLRYRRVIGIVPTGWVLSSKRKVFSPPPSSASAPLAIEVHLIPYSEHSSWTELREAVRFFRPRKIVPTVYSDAKDREAVVKRLADLTDATAAKRAFFAAAFGSGGGGGAAAATGSLQGSTTTSMSSKEGGEDEDDDLVVVEGGGGETAAAAASPPPAKRAKVQQPATAAAAAAPASFSASTRGGGSIASYFSPAPARVPAAAAPSSVVELLDD